MAITYSRILSKRSCVNTLTALASLLIVALQPVAAQSNANALNQLLKTNPALASQLSPAVNDSLQQLLHNRQSQPSRSDTTTTVDSAPADSIIQPKRSIYQKLFAGQTIHPDSLMRTLDIFGHDIFARNTNTAISNETQAVPATYAIGPGDELIVSLWGRLNEEHRLSVDRNGSIKLPYIGPQSVAGLSFGQMEKVVGEKLQTIEGVKVNITMGRLRSIPVYVIGEVQRPGMYTVSALSSITSLLFAAGGPNANGSLRTIELRRGNKLVQKIDFYEFLMTGSLGSGLRLQPDDVLLVPVVRNMIAVAGNVRRSAIYEITGSTSLKDALTLAGGISPAAWTNRIQIERMFDNQYQTILDIKSETKGTIPNFTVRDGDVIKLFPVVDFNEQVVTLEGNVRRPGKFQLTPNMRLSDLITSYETLLPETYFTYAVIERFDAPSYLARVIPFNIQAILNDATHPDNLTLQSRDRVIVYHQDFFEPDRSVTIEGSITNPGKFKLLENMKIRDLILQAGGLNDEASPIRGELYRRQLNGEQVTTEKISFSVEQAMTNHPDHNLPLRKSDRLYIRQKRGWEAERTVFLGGEFNYPGRYVIYEGESLAELIDRAGGFAVDAYVDAAVFTRQSVRELETKRKEEYLQTLESNILQTAAALAASGESAEIRTIMEQQMRMAEKMRELKPQGRVIIDLSDNDALESFLLETDDFLFVPKRHNTVTVIGEVFNPATFAVDNNSDRTDTYLRKTGGLKQSADKKSIYIITANGSVVSQKMTKVKRYNLKPGDVVVVPQKIDVNQGYRAFIQTLDVISKLVTITNNTASTVFYARELLK
jgi:protein involved in polysaccharide export with SLBB domain